MHGPDRAMLAPHPSPIVEAGASSANGQVCRESQKHDEIMPFGIGTQRNIGGAGRTERRVRASHFSAVLDHHYPQPWRLVCKSSPKSSRREFQTEKG
jgi:hypothetical protein